MNTLASARCEGVSAVAKMAAAISVPDTAHLRILVTIRFGIRFSPLYETRGNPRQRSG